MLPLLRLAADSPKQFNGRAGRGEHRCGAHVSPQRSAENKGHVQFIGYCTAWLAVNGWPPPPLLFSPLSYVLGNGRDFQATCRQAAISAHVGLFVNKGNRSNDKTSKFWRRNRLFGDRCCIGNKKRHTTPERDLQIYTKKLE